MKNYIFILSCLLFSFALCLSTEAQIITTIAGNGTVGFSGDGGPATAAQFNTVYGGVTVDYSGNVYITDNSNYRIRKVSPSGIITTIAGTGTPGYTGDGGPAPAAEIESPLAIAVDSAGNIYFSDGPRIREINIFGIISTFAGNGTFGYSGDGGVATAAEIGHSNGIAIDGVGNVYFSDYDYGVIRKINTSGIISTFAGIAGSYGYTGDGGPATAAQIGYNIYGVAADSYGNVYLSSWEYERIRRVNAAGIISTFAGNGTNGFSGDDGPATAAHIGQVWSVAMDRAGNMYFSDVFNQRIRKVDVSGIITTIGGTGAVGFSGDGGPASVAELNTPYGIAADGSGNVYISDGYNYRIRKITNFNRPVYFTNGQSQSFTVCENSIGDSINSLLPVFDSDSYQLETWASVLSPVHGSVVSVDTMTSGSDTLYPHGLFYSPASGYAGNDSFQVRVTDGIVADTTTIHVTINPAPSVPVAIGTGSAVVCPGYTVTLGDTTAGGAWSCITPATATIGSASGIVTGVAAGTTTVSYTLLSNSCAATTIVSVNLNPTSISGIIGFCIGATSSLTDGTSGGAWGSGNTAVATVDASGVVSGVSQGTAAITYAVSGICSPATTVVTVYPLPTTITGTTHVCTGTATTLGESVTGGTWSSSNSSVASAGITSGIITGGSVAAASMATITYTAPGACATSIVATVNPQPAPISGISSLCAGTTTPLFESVGGGGWSSGNSTVATVGSTGVVAGVAGGTAAISYSLGAGCSVATEMSVNPLPSLITGITSLCLSTTTTLADTTASGIWSSNNTGVASVDAGSGTVMANAITPGTATISYTSVITGCAATTVVTVNAGPLPMSGTQIVCAGGVTYLSDPAGGGAGGIGPGTWSSGSTAIATVDADGGVYGVAAGTVVITYTYNTCSVTAIVTVNPAPYLIIGASEICVGLTTLLSDVSTGGVWSSSNTAAATVGAASGLVSVVVPGTTTITYTLPTGCATTKSVTVNTTPGAITGMTHVCPGAETTLTDAGGGSWSSSPASGGVATVGTTGVVNGITPGTTTITYSLGAGCSANTTVTVNPLPSAISGTFTVCPGSATNLTDGGGGTWVSSNTSVATAGTATGYITGVTSGTSIVTYTLPTGCATMQAITVNPLPAIPIAAAGALSLCPGATITLASSPAGGAWSSGTTTVATVGSTGIVTGVIPGTAAIIYSLGTGCSRAATVTVNPLPAVITGTMNVCAGLTTNLVETTTGGTWSPAIGSIATVNGGGMVSGVASGTANITYTISATGCARSATVTVNPLPGPITGPTAECVGATMTETPLFGGGTWSSTSTAVATIGSSGIVTGVTTGTTAITYTSAAGCKANTTITISLSPVAIAGASSVCANDTTTLSDPGVGGGVWSSSSTMVATIGSLTGIVSGAIASTATISYSLGTGCTVTKIITVDPAPAVPMATGTGSICIGATTTLSDATTGGTWSSSTTAIATVLGAGVVTGGAAGVDTVIYTYGGCAATILVTVNLTPSAITGTAHVCAGATTVLVDGVSGGTWSSGPAGGGVATVDGTGTVTGVAAGTANITYAIGSCTATRTVTVNPISPITGSTGVCVGATTTLSDATTGGAWSSGTTSVATALGTGIVTGVLTGTSIIAYTTAAGCTATTAVTVNLAPSILSGTFHVCAGSTTTLTDAAGGGTWASSNSSVATVPSGAGTVAGAVPGTTTITYSLGSGCTVNSIVTVYLTPVGITGANNVCAGSTTALSDGTSGGIWSSVPTSIATITGGTVTGVSAGTALISYSFATGCRTTMDVTVNPLPMPITGTFNVCAGLTTSLNSTPAGGAWSSGSTGIATTNVTGTITGVLPGTSTITYSLPTGCITTATVIVNAAPAAITGSTSMCIGSTAALTDPGGGAWNSSNTAVATINATGLVDGLAIGTSTISYTVGGCPATTVVTVNPLPDAISGTFNLCAGATITLTDLPGGGTWSSSSPSTATVDESAGGVLGVAPGTATIAYSLGAGCTVAATVTVEPLPPPITGVPEVCLGYTTTLSDAAYGGGVWSSNNTAIAPITAGAGGTGVVHGIAGGAATISYSNGTGCPATRIVTVVAVPAITGVGDMCSFGPTMHVADADTGGAWTSTLATVSSVGVVTSYAAGGATLTYTLPSGCFTTAAFAIHPLPGPVTGTSHFCMGLTTTLSDTSTTGTWSSSNTDVANISTIGFVTSVSAGTATISYTLPTGCSETELLTVDSPPSAGVITGASSVCVGSVISLTDAAASAGGIWSSSTAGGGVATVVSGVVSGVNAGVDTIKYVVSNTCGTAVTTKTVTVNPLPDAGAISSVVPIAAGVCVGDTIVLFESSPGGVWSSSNASATVSDGIVICAAIGTDTINYSVTNSCGTATATQSVTVNTLPDPGIISGIDSLCQGASLTLSITAAGGTWSSSNGDISVSGAGLISALSAGVDTITYSLTNTCGTATASFTVLVKTAPETVSITGPTSVCIGSKDTLIGTPAGGSWNMTNGNAIVTSTATGAIVTGVTAGVDTVAYAVTSDCGVSGAVYPVMVLSQNECDTKAPSGSPQGGEVLRVWPNPNDGAFTVIVSSDVDEVVHVVVTNIVGEQVREIEGITNKAAEIKLNGAAGVYFISAFTAKGSYMAKVAVE